VARLLRGRRGFRARLPAPALADRVEEQARVGVRALAAAKVAADRGLEAALASCKARRLTPEPIW